MCAFYFIPSTSTPANANDIGIGWKKKHSETENVINNEQNSLKSPNESGCVCMCVCVCRAHGHGASAVASLNAKLLNYRNNSRLQFVQCEICNCQGGGQIRFHF